MRAFMEPSSAILMVQLQILQVTQVYCVLNAFFAEVLALEVACLKRWNNPLIECDSSLVIQAFHNLFLVPWCLRRRWFNYCLFLKHIQFWFFPIYLEKVIFMRTSWQIFVPKPTFVILGGILSHPLLSMTFLGIEFSFLRTGFVIFSCGFWSDPPILFMFFFFFFFTFLFI